MEIIAAIFIGLFIMCVCAGINIVITEHKAIMDMGKLCNILLKERENNEKKV